ncbi:hypothetical protein [Dongshaea marina]|nr:hypothetical protein [Dongshaea marina]
MLPSDPLSEPVTNIFHELLITPHFWGVILVVVAIGIVRDSLKKRG